MPELIGNAAKNIVVAERGRHLVTLRSNLDNRVVYAQPQHAMYVEPMSGPPHALTLGATLVTPDQSLQGEFKLAWDLQPRSGHYG